MGNREINEIERRISTAVSRGGYKLFVSLEGGIKKK